MSTLNEQVNCINESDINVYQIKISEAFASDKKTMIINSTEDHAATLISELIKNSKDNFCIFCNKLRANVYNSPKVLEALSDAIRRNVRFRILTKQEPEAKNFIDIIKTYDLAEVYRSSDRDVLSLKQNFAISDYNAFRYESDSKKIGAIGAINYIKTTLNLLVQFDKMYSREKLIA